jgi:hypothetical protein
LLIKEIEKRECLAWKGLRGGWKIMLTCLSMLSLSIFGREKDKRVSLGEDFWEEGEKVYEEENNMLEAPFTEAEVKKAIFGSYAEGAPGPDGFSFLFYQVL